jgi:hypothetical protein
MNNVRSNQLVILSAAVAALAVGIGACVVALLLLVHTIG